MVAWRIAGLDSGEQPTEVIQNDPGDLEVEGFHAASFGGTVDAGVGQLVAGTNADGKNASGAVVPLERHFAIRIHGDLWGGDVGGQGVDEPLGLDIAVKAGRDSSIAIPAGLARLAEGVIKLLECAGFAVAQRDGLEGFTIEFVKHGGDLLGFGAEAKTGVEVQGVGCCGEGQGFHRSVANAFSVKLPKNMRFFISRNLANWPSTASKVNCDTSL